MDPFPETFEEEGLVEDAEISVSGQQGPHDRGGQRVESVRAGDALEVFGDETQTEYAEFVESQPL